MALTDRQIGLPAPSRDTSTPFGIRVAPDTWMRKRGIGTLFYIAYAAAFSLALATAGVAVLLSLGSDEPLAPTIAGDLTFWVAAAFAMRFAVRIARSGLRISSNGVCLKGLLRTRTLPFASVEGFAPGAYLGGALRSEVGVNLVRRDERDLRVWAMRKGAPSSGEGLKKAKDALQPLCDELNQLLQAMKGNVISGGELARAKPVTRAEAERA